MKKVVPLNAHLIPDNAVRVFKGTIFDVYHWQQEMFDGSLDTFEMLKRVDTLKVLAIVDEKLVILEEEQPKFGTFIDIPGGRHDHENESNLDAAKREMLEETGMTFKNWRLIDVEQPMVKAEWFSYLYLAYDLDQQVEPVLDAGEKISVNYITLDEYRGLRRDPKLRWWPEVLDDVMSIEDLLALPEFNGKEIER